MTHSEEVFEGLREHAFRVAYQMIGGAADAEDLVQDAWLSRTSMARRAPLLGVTAEVDEAGPSGSGGRRSRVAVAHVRPDRYVRPSIQMASLSLHRVSSPFFICSPQPVAPLAEAVPPMGVRGVVRTGSKGG